jgi:CHAT domain-containing protein
VAPSSLRVWPHCFFLFVMAALCSMDSFGQAGEVDRRERLEAAWEQADQDRAKGQYREALRQLEIAQAESRSESELAQTALRAGGVATRLGRYAQAASFLEVAQDRRALLDSGSSIVLEMELGYLAVELDSLNSAVRHFGNAAKDARKGGLLELEVRATINALRAQMDNQDLAGLESRLADLQDRAGGLDRSDDTAFLLVSVGDLQRRAVDEFRSDLVLIATAYENFKLAMEFARTDRTKGQVYGFLGALYEREDQFEEALTLTHEAIYYAQAASAEEQLYRWEWQLGRILNAQGEPEDARQAYKRSVAILKRLRPSLVPGSRQTFARLVAPVYAEYADILLRQSTDADSRGNGQAILSEVRDQLETLKRGEIENYFGNQCVVVSQPEDHAGASSGKAVAVIYPVLFEDRIEVLVEAGGPMLQFTTPVGRRQVTRIVRKLRLSLQRASTGTDYLEPAQRLYQWLIAPSLGVLEQQGIKTLMMVPGGALRTVPLAALHDGDHFLVERFAIANTPAIRLLERAASKSSPNLLIGGVAQSVQGFQELPGVEREIRTVSSMYPSETLINEMFRVDAVRRQLASGGFSIAHFATHGEFRKNFAESYIITYDDRLTLDGLRAILDQRGEEPLDLLVLSACQTAAGDDQAALGLAGVAVQSGARTAVASLWYISDEATANLIEMFYENLSKPGATKAESLRQAQLALLASERFSHPAFWAPYLLIGSWL